MHFLVKRHIRYGAGVFSRNKDVEDAAKYAFLLSVASHITGLVIVNSLLTNYSAGNEG